MSTILQVDSGGVVIPSFGSGIVQSDSSGNLSSSATVTLSSAIIINGNGTNIQLQVSGNTKFFVDGTTMAFFGHPASTQQTVSGSRGGNAALASLLTALANYGLIVDSSS
jgi:hypothetical protein